MPKPEKTHKVNAIHSFDEFDEIHYPRPEESDFTILAQKALSRRHFLGSTAKAGLAAFVFSAAPTHKADAEDRFGFEAVKANSQDSITLPKGYSWHSVVMWGDPLWSKGASFDHETRGNGESQEMAFGDNNDGMALFTLGGKNILAVNNEYSNLPIIYGNRESGRPENADDLRKGKAAHGLSICEIAQSNGRWSVVLDSPFNRRITPDTPMTITGPARGHELLKTEADPSGTRSLGTWNNCGNGVTPWGTYLACEENFNGYFSSSDDAFEATVEMTRYGIGPKDWGYAWASGDERFDIAKHPNECNRVGYVVEVDPLDPASTPKKLTALGRFKHENAEVVLAHNGQVVVYMGDDERGEFLYKFVSSAKFSSQGDNTALLEEGRLFAAKFNDDLTGEWLELTPVTTGLASEAEICIHTRIAASAVGATTMDRPEWVAASPHSAEVYCSLTNNKNRAVKPNAGGDETPLNGPNPRKANPYGQIVRWRPDGGDHLAKDFSWDLFVVAGNPLVHDDAYGGSDNVTPENMFNSPDGLSFDSNGFLWIQTDGNHSSSGDFRAMGNNQMLVGDSASGEIRRFLVGPIGCEVTGLTWSADKRTLFLGIQHPDEKGGSHFPQGDGATPRSSVIAVTRDDGEPIL